MPAPKTSKHIFSQLFASVRLSEALFSVGHRRLAHAASSVSGAECTTQTVCERLPGWGICS